MKWNMKQKWNSNWNSQVFENAMFTSNVSVFQCFLVFLSVGAIIKFPLYIFSHGKTYILALRGGTVEQMTYFFTLTFMFQAFKNVPLTVPLHGCCSTSKWNK